MWRHTGPAGTRPGVLDGPDISVVVTAYAQVRATDPDASDDHAVALTAKELRTSEARVNVALRWDAEQRIQAPGPSWPAGASPP